MQHLLPLRLCPCQIEELVDHDAETADYVANLEARVTQGGRLMAQANGNFAIFKPQAASG